MTDKAVSAAIWRIRNGIERAAWGMEPQALDWLVNHGDLEPLVRDTLATVNRKRMVRTARVQANYKRALGSPENSQKSLKSAPTLPDTPRSDEEQQTPVEARGVHVPGRDQVRP